MCSIEKVNSKNTNFITVLYSHKMYSLAITKEHIKEIK